jgi:hypothetical protein
MNCTQRQIYDHTAAQIVGESRVVVPRRSDLVTERVAWHADSVLEGFNGTIFAYGQVRGLEWRVGGTWQSCHHRRPS